MRAKQNSRSIIRGFRQLIVTLKIDEKLNYRKTTVNEFCNLIHISK